MPAFVRCGRRPTLPIAALVGFLGLCLGLSAGNIRSGEIIRLQAGDWDRRDTLIRRDWSWDDAPESLRRAWTSQVRPATSTSVAAQPTAVALSPHAPGKSVNAGSSAPIPAQLDAVFSPDKGIADRTHPDGLQLTFMIPAALAFSAKATLDLTVVTANDPTATPWRWERTEEHLTLLFNGRPVWRYNIALTVNPKYPQQSRNAYIHPVWSPGGVIVTGDYEGSHPHHRGLFLAYAQTKVQGTKDKIDFWNIHRDSARIVFDRLESPSAGVVSAHVRMHHRWLRKGDVPVLRETWDLSTSALPDQAGWILDLTVNQTAIDAPLELLPHRYGGMAYRGREPFLTNPFVLTAEGRTTRADADQKPARWIDLAGPVAPGSSTIVGCLIADHPGNLRHPNVVRIHPVSLPFFSYTPGHTMHKTPLVIGTDAPFVSKFRILVHDGKPDAAKDDAVWRDFAHPPNVVIDSKNQSPPKP